MDRAGIVMVRNFIVVSFDLRQRALLHALVTAMQRSSSIHIGVNAQTRQTVLTRFLWCAGFSGLGVVRSVNRWDPRSDEVRRSAIIQRQLAVVQSTTILFFL